MQKLYARQKDPHALVINYHIACVAGVKIGRAREKGKERLQGHHCFLHFSRSDSECQNSDWSELIKCQSST